MTYHEALTANRFENEDRITEADTYVRKECLSLVDQGFITGAFPFGSSQFDDANILSDYDIIIAIQEDGVDEEMRSLGAIHDFAKNTYRNTGVPVEVTCYTTDQLTEGLHGLPDTMLEWLKNQAKHHQDKIIGDDFVAAIKLARRGESALDLAHIDKYVDGTRGIMKKSWLQGVYFRPHDLLSVTLNTPHIIGRKVVDTLQRSGAIPKGTLKDLRKVSIKEAVLNVFSGDSKIAYLYQAINDDMMRYKDDLVPQADQLSIDEYDQIVEATLEDNLPKAIELLRRIQEECRRVYNESSQIQQAAISPYVERGSNLTDEERHSRMVDELRIQQLNST